MKKRIRMALDMAMVVLLPLLMAYSLIGEKLHEIIGTVIFVLFFIHHILNRKWYGAMLRGNYSSARILQTILNVFLLVFMILQPVSGILLSKHLYVSVPTLGITATAREIHLFLAYWGFILMCVHGGTHLSAPIKKLKKYGKTTWVSVLGTCTVVAIYGGFAFMKRQLPLYMLRRTAFVFFDYNEPIPFFFIDYFAIMVLFTALGYLIMQGTREK